MAENTDWSDPHGLVLFEARELRRKQDARLKSLQTLSRGILAGFVSTGAIAVAASDELGPIFAALVFAFALLMVVPASMVERSARRWQEGPEIEELVGNLIASAPATIPLEMDLAFTYKNKKHHKENEESLDKATFYVVLQGAIAFGSTANLLFALLQIA